MSVGERLRRIESRLDTIEEHIDARITRHKEQNEATVKELARTVVTDFGARLQTLEKQDIADNAVRTYRKLLVGGLISVGVLLVAVVGLLLQVLGKVD